MTVFTQLYYLSAPNCYKTPPITECCTFKALKMGRKTAVQDWHTQNPDQNIKQEMVQSCPGWSSEGIFFGMLRYTGHSSLWLPATEYRECRLLRMSWKK
jgi:hypothetical protein